MSGLSPEEFEGILGDVAKEFNPFVEEKEPVAKELPKMEEPKEETVAELAEELKEKQEVEEPKVEEPKVDLFSKRFSALSKREKRLVEKERELKNQANELEVLKQRLAELEKPRVEEPKKEIPLRDRLRSNPMEVLEELGLDFEKLTEIQLNGKKPTMDLQLMQLKEELAQYKQELSRLQKEEIDNLKKDFETREQARQREETERQINYFKNDIVTFIETENAKDQSKYAHIMVEDLDIAQEVCDLIGMHYAKYQESLDMKDAIELIENELKAKADRYRSINYNSSPSQAVEQSAPKLRTNSKTLKNQASLGTQKKYASQEDELRDLANMLKTYDL
jgi:hypothetical protein